MHVELFRQLSGFVDQRQALAEGDPALPADFAHEVSCRNFIVLFAPTIMVLPASKLVCWFQNSSASGFVVTCCDRCCARFAVALRRDD